MDHVSVDYGAGLAARTLDQLGQFTLIADPVAWSLCRDCLPSPRYEFKGTTLERDELRELAAAISPGAAIVGLGGGTAIDAAKYCALQQGGGAATLIPTLTSTNAAFADFISVRVNGEAAGIRAVGAPRRVIVDSNLLSLADPRLNRAGYADLLAFGTELEDWRNGTARGSSEFQQMAPSIAELVAAALSFAPQLGVGDPAAWEGLMRLFEVGSRLVDEAPGIPVGAGGEHLFAWCVEVVTRSHHMHGELVALGIVVAEYLFGGNRFVNALDAAQVRWRPSELSLSWKNVEDSLLSVAEYNRRVRHFDTIISSTEWTAAKLRQLHDYLYLDFGV